MSGPAMALIAVVIYFTILMIVSLVGYINADRLEAWAERRFSKKLRRRN